MRSKPMKYNPLYIVLWTISRYITEENMDKIKYEVGIRKNIRATTLLKIISQFMDLETLLRHPKFPEDAWIYNYLKYEVRYGYPRTKLIKRYETEVVIPVENNFRELLAWMNEK